MSLKYALACLSAVGLDAKRAFVIVDTQECFLESGSLPVVASQIIPKLNEIRNQKDCLFDVVVKTQEGDTPQPRSPRSPRQFPPNVFSHFSLCNISVEQ